MICGSSWIFSDKRYHLEIIYFFLANIHVFKISIPVLIMIECLPDLFLNFRKWYL